MAWDTSMSAVTAGTYAAAGYTLAEIVTLVGNGMGWETPTTAQKTKIYQAITGVAQSCATWKGEDWWWLRATSSFPTVASTASYALRTVNSNAMQSLWAIQRVYYDDDWVLTPMDYRDYRQWYIVSRPTATTAQPTEYSITGEPPYIWTRPIANDAYTLYVDYIQRHSKIDSGSADSLLIVPAEFQHGIYVKGSLWELRHEKQDIASLEQCPGFMEAINRMVAAQLEHYDDKAINKFSDIVGTWPHDRKVMAGLISTV